jgi:LysR family hydrogen peroxide-inducible transcriptional activator
LRFAPPQPGRTVGLVWRRTSPRKADFLALGEVITDALDLPSAHAQVAKRPARAGRR